MAALNRIASEGRKFGLALIVSSQCAAHLSRDVLANTVTKIVMKTDRTEAAAAARRFQIDRDLLETLQDPGHALLHFASEADWREVRIGGGISWRSISNGRPFSKGRGVGLTSRSLGVNRTLSCMQRFTPKESRCSS